MKSNKGKFRDCFEVQNKQFNLFFCSNKNYCKIALFQNPVGVEPYDTISWEDEHPFCHLFCCSPGYRYEFLDT